MLEPIPDIERRKPVEIDQRDVTIARLQERLNFSLVVILALVGLVVFLVVAIMATPDCMKP